MKFHILLYKLLLILFVGLFFVETISAKTSQSLAIRASLPGGTAAYPFAVLRYNLFQNDFLTTTEGKNSLFFEFDTEAIFLNTMFLLYKESFSIKAGPLISGHLVDWQNLEFITDENGQRQKFAGIKAPSLAGGGVISARFKSGKTLSYTGSYEKAFLAPLEKTTLFKQVNATSFITNKISFGYYGIYSKTPGLDLGQKYSVAISHKKILEAHNYRYASFESGNASEIIEASLNWQRSYRLSSLILKTNVNTILQSTSAPKEKFDFIQSNSVGGPEYQYRRVAGFAFSEFRNPAFALLNFDLYLPMTKNLFLWLVNDYLLLDRKIAGRKLHIGSGLGFFWHISKKGWYQNSSLFLRADYAITARRKTATDFWQFFTGLNIKW